MILQIDCFYILKLLQIDHGVILCEVYTKKLKNTSIQNYLIEA